MKSRPVLWRKELKGWRGSRRGGEDLAMCFPPRHLWRSRPELLMPSLPLQGVLVRKKRKNYFILTRLQILKMLLLNKLWYSKFELTMRGGVDCTPETYSSWNRSPKYDFWLIFIVTSLIEHISALSDPILIKSTSFGPLGGAKSHYFFDPCSQTKLKSSKTRKIGRARGRIVWNCDDDGF